MASMAEAEAALLYPNGSGTEVPNGAAGYYMLGIICRLTDRRQAAIGHYTQALLLDPFLWSAYEDLCVLGAEEDAASLYGDMAVIRLQHQHQHQQHLHWELQTQSSAPAVLFADHADSIGPSPSSHRSNYTSGGSPKHSRLSMLVPADDMAAVATSTCGGVGFISATSSDSLFVVNSAFVTPTAGSSQMTVPQIPGKSLHGLPNTLSSGLPGAGAEIMGRGNAGAGHPQQRRKFVDEGKFRKSIRSPSARAAYSQVSGRLFDPVPRRSSRLAGDGKTAFVQMGSSGNSGASQGSASTSGNGGGVLPGSFGAAFGTSRGSNTGNLQQSTVRKGLSFGTPDINSDDGKRNVESVESSGIEDGTIGSRRIGTADDESLYRSRSNSLAGSANHGSRGMEGALEVLNLLRTFGEGFRHLCMYRCQEALQTFSKLPQQQFATGWVLCQVARACCEMVDYPEAERVFSWARRISPHHLEGTDIFSTVLYHLKRDVELSYLAQETIAMDRLSPQAWCVMGNCFSLQKDHETALKFFQRALQLNSHYTYAYTLCGHEYVAMEDFEEGLTCYRNAIRIDARHYNAWYGLGTIYFRQEKFELAEYHFRRALQINGRSSVLHCYLGMALHALKKNSEALALLEQAILADVKNPLSRYQKANVLMSEERYHDALAELEQLKEIAPRESSVYFLMGKIYKRLDLPERAMYHFCIALDLKPSTADINLIKIAIEKLHVPDDLEDENL